MSDNWPDESLNLNTDLNTDLENISECELSNITISSTSSEPQTSDVQQISPTTLLDHKKHFDSDQVSLESRESVSTEHSLTGTLPKRHQLSKTKVTELKQLMLKVREAHAECKTNEFVLDCYKKCENGIPKELLSKLKEVIEESSIPEMAKMKTRSGELLNIFGLEDEDLLAASGKELSTFEKTILEKHARDMIKSEIEGMKTQRHKLRGMLGKHAEKKVQEETSFLNENRAQLANLYESVEETSVQCSQVLVSSNEMMQELVHLKHTSSKELQVISYQLLKDKAEYINASTSILKLKTEQSLYENKNYVQFVNSLGDNLSKSVTEGEMELKKVQTNLDVYMKKEASSKVYKQIVSVYVNALKELEHKKQTLSLLNDCDKEGI